MTDLALYVRAGTVGNIISQTDINVSDMHIIIN